MTGQESDAARPNAARPNAARPNAARPNIKPPQLTVFYDGSCPLCSREIAHYRRLDRNGQVDWQDIGNDSAPLAGTDISHDAAMTRLHVIDAAGRTRIGADAFLQIWALMPGWRWLGRLVRLLRLTPLLSAGYEWWVRRRARRLSCNVDCARPGRGH